MGKVLMNSQNIQKKASGAQQSISMMPNSKMGVSKPTQGLNIVERIRKNALKKHKRGDEIMLVSILELKCDRGLYITEQVIKNESFSRRT